MNTFLSCEFSYYKKVFIGLTIIVLSVFILNKIVDIHMYANAIYILAVFIITFNIVATILKIIVLALG